MVNVHVTFLGIVISGWIRGKTTGISTPFGEVS